MMLLAEAFVRLLELWDQGYLGQLPDALLQDRIPVILLQILNWTLMGESLAGLGGPDQALETMAYAVFSPLFLSPISYQRRS